MSKTLVPKTLSKLQDWTFTVDYEGIAWAVFDRKGESMNSLGRRPTEELDQIVKVVEEAKAGEIKGLDGSFSSVPWMTNR